MSRLAGRARAAILALAAVLDSSAAIAAAPAASRPDQQILVMLRTGPQHYQPDAAYGGGYGDGQGRSTRRRAAERLARAQGLSVADEWPMALLNVDCFVMNVPSDVSRDEVVRRLNRDPAVSWSQPLHLYQGQGTAPTGTDPLYAVQPTAKEWRLDALHRIATGKGVRIAVVDSMIDSAHVDLKGAVERVENFVGDRPAVPESHGTGVAGVIAARAGNGVGIVGVAPQARLMGLRACWQLSGVAAGGGTVCDTLSLARALEFAVAHGAKIVNMSLSGPNDLLLSKLIDVALGARITVVAAYDRHDPHGGFPASHPGVVAVADEAGSPVPGVMTAPGRDVPTTEPGGRWALVNGSSFSAAQVSGLFALLRQNNPVLHGASEIVSTRPAGLVDACATLMRRSPPCHCACDDRLAMSGHR